MYMVKKYTVVDLFAGVGGLSYGFFNNQNFEILMANECDKDTATAYALNHPTVKVLNCDIREITKEHLRDKSNSKVDIVVGGPPCQSYSTLGKRKNDDRANLFYEFARIINILQPQIFLFENVIGLLSMEKGSLFRIVQSQFEQLGYQLEYKVLNAVHFGVPQVRERVILVGKKNAVSFRFPQPTHGEVDNSLNKLLPAVTMGDALGDLSELESGGVSTHYKCGSLNHFQSIMRRNATQLEEHSAPNNGAHLQKIMKTLQDGQTKDDLPEDIRPKSGYKNTYAKLWWDRPVPTVTRNFACVSSSRCIHPRDSRALTTREGARLQSFPDTFRFFGSRGKKNLQIGNAVPPLLSIKLAEQVFVYLKESECV